MISFSQLLSGGLKLISHLPPTTKLCSLHQFAALSSYSGHTLRSTASKDLPIKHSDSVLCSSGQTRWASDSTREASKAAAALKVQRLNEAHDRRTRLQEFQDRKRKTANWASKQPILGDTVTPAPADESDATQLTVTPTEGPVGDVQIARVLNHPALIITRPIEWGTMIFGYEQANKYTIYDQDGVLVAVMAEEFSGIGNEIGRQVLRTRRSFTATVLSADGSQVIFRVRRPAYLISSTMFVEDGAGTVIGEIHQRWNLIKRNYDLYINKSQFAAISGNFLAWEFELKGNTGATRALIDRNFQGFGKELFTDAGKYVIHFGCAPQQAADIATTTVRARLNKADSPPVTPVAMARTDVAVIPTVTGNQLVVQEPLPLSERMITLACAIAIDYDYFSQHSHSSGFMPFFMPIPMPMPGGGGGGDVGAAGAGAAAGEVGAGGGGAAGGAAAGGMGGEMGSASGSGLEQDLGGDAFPSDSGASPGSGSGGDTWGDSQEGFKWDNGDGGGAGDGGAADAGGEGGGVLGTLWGIFNDGE